MNKKIITGLAVILSMTACEYEFDVTSPVGEDRMMVEWIVGLDDIDYIKVRKAVPVGKAAQEGNYYEIESMRFTEDEVEVPLFKDPEGSYYYSVHTPKQGSRLEFDLSTKDEPSIKAYTTVPDKVNAQFTYTASQDEIHWQMKVDDVKDKNFALLAFAGVEYTDEEGEVRQLWNEATISAELSGNTYYGFFNSSLRVVNYSVKGKVSCSLTLLRGEEIPDGNFAFKTYSAAKYKLVLLVLSDEAYGYFNARYNQDNNFLAKLGLAPSNYAYTNVHGGYGVFGAVTREEKIFEIK